METCVKILKQNQLKITPQRLAILRFLNNNKSHPTADEIYQALKKENPSLSKTTVYNSLVTLHQNKIIQILTIFDKEHRYDIREESHHHFLCKKCEKIIDLKIVCPNMKKIKNEFGHQVDEVHGYFEGTCKNCLEKEEKK